MPSTAKLRSLLHSYRLQLRHSSRVTVAALLSFAIAQVLNLPMPLWAVLTAIIVTQMNVGRSLKTAIDYLAGTLGGVVYGAIFAELLPHSSEIALLSVLALVVAPLTLIATLSPRMTVAPITAVIVILVPTITHVSPLASAFDRTLEVALGGLIGLLVSFLILPSNAHRLAIEAAAHTLEQIERAFSELLAGLKQGLDMTALHRIQDHIGQALVQLAAIRGEAQHERSAYLTTAPDPGPLTSSLLRLRHDLIMIGRVTLTPMPELFYLRLQAPLADINLAFARYLHASGAALLAHREPPALDEVEAALAAYAEAITSLRSDGLTRTLHDDEAERFFALGFAFEQMHQSFKELGKCVTELAGATGSSQPPILKS